MDSDQIYSGGNTGMQGVGVGEFHSRSLADETDSASNFGLNLAIPSMFSPFPPLAQGGGAEMLPYSSWPTLHRTYSGASTSQNAFINPNYSLDTLNSARPALLHADSMESNGENSSFATYNPLPDYNMQQNSDLHRRVLSPTESNSSVETETIPRTPLTANPLGDVPSAIPGLYSATGFNILPILCRLNERLKKCTLQVGPVDLSCAFTVTDSRRFDMPIVYASEKFLELTGYTLKEILGRNCRFLQSPHGHVNKGQLRKYTDNNVVTYFSKMIGMGVDSQANLINYRKCGQPFINLLTVIPVPEVDEAEAIYHVGLQIDLVEQPNTILSNMREGVYTFTEQSKITDTARSNLVPRKSSGDNPKVEEGLAVDLMSEHPQIDISGPNRLPGNAHSDFLRLLFDEIDDFVHVLSLKGNLLYMSPSVSKILEYESQELVGKPLADIAHPSDVVSVMRELKECSSNPFGSVNLLLRFRRKNSGYIWIESVGRLHLEQGKSRKCVICTGRPRNVVNLSWERIESYGGLTQHEIWATISLSGLFLTISQGTNELSNTSNLLAGKNIMELTEIMEEKRGLQSVFSDFLFPSLRSSESDSSYRVQHHLFGDLVESTFFYSIISDSSLQSSVAVVRIKKVGSQMISPWGITKEGNVFADIETTKSTSWQFELHQIRSQNRKMKEEIKSLQTLIERSSQ